MLRIVIARQRQEVEGFWHVEEKMTTNMFSLGQLSRGNIACPLSAAIIALLQTTMNGEIVSSH
jgi:hypothetical protein